MNFPREFNDDLSDLTGGSAPLDKPSAADPFTAPNGYKSPTYTEPCSKCRGSGNWRPGYPCFTCKGVGTKTFKTPAAQRAKAKVANRARKQRTVEETTAANLEGFKAAQPEVWAWMDGNDFAFAVAMIEAVKKYGSLTEKQLAACTRMIEKRAASIAEKAERIATAPVADAAGIDRLKQAFDKAAAITAGKKVSGLYLRSPKITIGDITISPAKAASANPGALYVKGSGEYLGKIADGKFIASRECTDEQKARVLAFVADPKAAAEAYGKETGTCCVCNAALTSKWRLQGIGPICAEKFGW